MDLITGVYLLETTMTLDISTSILFFFILNVKVYNFLLLILLLMSAPDSGPTDTLLPGSGSGVRTSVCSDTRAGVRTTGEPVTNLLISLNDKTGDPAHSQSHD